MIFCDPNDVDVVWGTVARATANGELGIAAKVAPCPPEAIPGRERLICVYTRDFRDRQDVGRVIQRLRELRLVETTNKRLYYKPGMPLPLTPYSICPSLIREDIFTYIGLASGNPWGLRASIYSSGDVFPPV